MAQWWGNYWWHLAMKPGLITSQESSDECESHPLILVRSIWSCRNILSTNILVIGSPFLCCLVSVSHLENRNLSLCYCWYWVRLNCPHYPGVWLPECNAEHSGDTHLPVTSRSPPSHLRPHLVFLCCGFIEISPRCPHCVTSHMRCGDTGAWHLAPISGGPRGREGPRSPDWLIIS